MAGIHVLQNHYKFAELYTLAALSYLNGTPKFCGVNN
jgi:hypothetical protein